MSRTLNTTQLPSTPWLQSSIYADYQTPPDVEWCATGEAAETGQVRQPPQVAPPALPPKKAAAQPNSLLDFIKCTSCGKEPHHAVESPCCGEVWCWACLVEAWPSTCALCNVPISPARYKPAKAIEKLLQAVKESAASSPRAEESPELDILFPCPDECGAILPLHELDEHMLTCPAELPCPNGCFAQLKKRDVEAHLGSECPLTFIHCRFGCEDQMMRREAEEHVNDNEVKHMNLLLARLEDQERKMAEMQQRMNETWANPENVVRVLRECVTAFLRGFRGSLNAHTWPLAVFVLVLASGLTILPFFYLLVLMLQNLPPAISPVVLPLGATVSVGFITLLFSLYCILC